MENIILEIRKELRKNIEPEYKKGEISFFKEEIKTYGVRTCVSRRISKEYFKKVKDLGKKKVFSLCEELLKSGYIQEIGIAFRWAFRFKDQYEKKDFKIFEKWLKKYVSNWANCDDFCTHNLGYFLAEFPEFIPIIKLWTKSKDRWTRRASAVIFIYPVRHKKYLKDVFEIADLLLLDQDYMVQKGYGWMLKEASNIYPKEVFNFVMKNKDKMPRTALRYAIEKYPNNLRKKAMEK
ncbi:MAG: DNA alkylation repair protein [Patescibacteria group bacterium]|nr:DNA alkylation repair protein [Patescibacteria group bacterium]